MSQVFFSSDLHFGHRLVAAIRADVEHVEDADVQAHDDAIVDRWNRVVGKWDKVYLLGDLSMGMPHGLKCAAQLNGRKFLIAGNHDLVHPRHRRGGSVLRRYLDIFEDVATVGEVKIGGRRVMLSHFPYSADRGDNIRYPQYRVPDTDLWLLHGHTHSEAVLTGPRELHVGWDAWKGPVSRDTIAAIITMQEAS